MKISIIESIEKFAVNRAMVKSLITRLSKHFKISAEYEVSVYFTGKDRIKSLNSEFRGKRGPTDVLSFPMNEGSEIVRADGVNPDGMPLLLGDIFVCPDFVLENNVAGRGEDFNYEIAYLIIHGFMHLIGYDHDDDGYQASPMRVAAEKFIRAEKIDADFCGTLMKRRLKCRRA